jgi:feruloyl esterase
MPTGITLTGSSWQDADKGLPRHCLVTGNTGARTGSDGRTYTISFEMRLPLEWNGRFLHQVNGGNDGVIVPALGDRAEGLVSGGWVPLARGFVVLSSDSGHSGADPANKPRGLAAGAAFGLDPQARRDYGYAADMTLSPIAKTVIAAYYGRRPDYSYMAGCSNGGRHAMVAAERMPENYDGFLVGNPGLNLPRAAIQHAWDVQALAKVDPDIRKSLTREDGRLISSRVIEACDALDGLKDGLTSNLAACQKTFSFDTLACKPDATEGCLSQRSTRSRRSLPTARQQARLHHLTGPSMAASAWELARLKVESTVAPWNNYPIIATMGAASLAYTFSTPPANRGRERQAGGFGYIRPGRPEGLCQARAFSPAMDFMTPPGVDDPRLAGLRKSPTRCSSITDK